MSAHEVTPAERRRRSRAAEAARANRRLRRDLYSLADGLIADVRHDARTTHDLRAKLDVARKILELVAPKS